MSAAKENDRTFIIRIWREAREVENASPILRGTIEHISGDESDYDKQALQDLGHILDFITPYIVDMNVKVGFCWQLRRWLKKILLRSQN